MTILSDRKFLDDIKEGDIINRMLGGSVPMQLTVTYADKDRIICGPWVFLRSTGGEVDEDLGWDGFTRTGSYISHKINDKP